MSRWTPVPKVTAVALGGAVATLLVWAADASRGLSVPPEAAAALTALLAFVFGYLRAPAGTEDDDAGITDLGLLAAVALAGLILLLVIVV